MTLIILISVLVAVAANFGMALISVRMARRHYQAARAFERATEIAEELKNVRA